MVHLPKDRADDRREFHLRKNIAFEIDTGRNFDQLDAVAREREQAALGDVEDGRFLGSSMRTAERPMFDDAHELA